MLTPRSQAYTPGTRSGLAKGSRLHTLHYKENRPLSSPECSKVGFPQDALNWQNGKPRTNEPNLAGHSSALESVIHTRLYTAQRRKESVSTVGTLVPLEA